MFTTCFSILWISKLFKRIDLRNHLKTKYEQDVYKCFCEYEKASQKLLKVTLDLEFLKKCKVFGVFPKFLRFKLYKRSLQNSYFYKTWQNKLLVKEIQDKRRSIDLFSEKKKCLFNSLSSLVGVVTLLRIRQYVSNRLNEQKTKTQETHSKKLRNLGIDRPLAPCDPSKVVLNFSTVPLSHRLKTLLAFGLDFCLPVYKIDKISYYLGFEKLIARLQKFDHPDVETSIQSVKNLAHKFFHSFKKSKVFSSIVTPGDLHLLREFSKNKEIVVCRPDKGRGVVVIDRSKYLENMKQMLQDKTKFRLIKDSIQQCTLVAQDKINRFLRNLLKKKTISPEIYHDLFASGSSPGVLYGLPKTHKPKFADKHTFRPIFAAYNTPAYKISKFLVPYLSELTTNEYTISSTDAFCTTLKNNRFPSDHFMCSFDISNLFTNVPLNETIDIICHLLFKNPYDTFLNMSETVFRKFLELSVMNSVFIFDNELYRQVDGLGMGLPLSPTFADIFLCYHEKHWLDDCPNDFKPVLYRRYVDDCFLLFKNSDQAKKFLTYLNSKHSNIQFTMEEEKSAQLPFLDTLIHRSSSFETSVYRKNTFSGLGLSYFSHCWNRFKLNSIKTLINRSYRICSTYSFLHREFEFLRKYFQNNGYPNRIIDNTIKKFLDGIFCKDKMRASSSSLITGPPKYFFVLPYFGHQSTKLKYELDQVLKKFYPKGILNIILVNNFRIGNFFRYKDKLPSEMRSSVCYKYCCARCGASYVGMSSRNIYQRIAEHRGVSYRTGRLLQSPPHSNVRLHADECNINISHSHFKILSSAKSEIDLKIIESLYINMIKPKLNEMISSYPLQCF